MKSYMFLAALSILSTVACSKSNTPSACSAEIISAHNMAIYSSKENREIFVNEFNKLIGSGSCTAIQVTTGKTLVINKDELQNRLNEKDHGVFKMSVDGKEVTMDATDGKWREEVEETRNPDGSGQTTFIQIAVPEVKTNEQ